MKFTCLQENLSKGLSIAYKAVPIKASLPILQNILLTTQNGRLKLAATNFDTTITTYIGASVEKDGSVTIPARLLKDFVSNLPANTVELTLNNDILHLNSDNIKSKFNGTNPESYPQVPLFPKEGKYVEIDPQEFNAAVSLVGFAASSDDSRPMFTGIYMNLDKETLILAATDGNRLSETSLKVKKAPKGFQFTTVIPAKTVIEVSKLFASSEENIRIATNSDENLVLFESGDTLVATRILNGDYPDYKRIIPINTSVTAEFSASEFLEAVKLINVFSRDGAGTITIKLDPKGLVELATSAKEIGEHESKISAEVEGQATEIVFNPKYLLDMLNALKTEKLKMHINNTSSPCLFKTDKEEFFLHIIAPIQVQS